uniref:Large ribosomal subunit protein uL18c n=1 Tax=Gastroclonium compressum TaxID=1852973 RepID=A0A173G070_GASCM|nr:50S ribosomal protein L18 [Coeloseira compressa]ANH09670.1 50S ribosomal protein L18 [Coeloseira compressa]
MKQKHKGTKNKPRLYIFKSNKHIYAQLINDTSNKIIASSSSISKNIKHKINKKVNCDTVKLIGQDIAEKFYQKDIKTIIFDRGQNKYHGKIQILAESLRKAGIIF